MKYFDVIQWAVVGRFFEFWLAPEEQREFERVVVVESCGIKPACLYEASCVDVVTKRGALLHAHWYGCHMGVTLTDDDTRAYIINRDTMFSFDAPVVENPKVKDCALMNKVDMSSNVKVVRYGHEYQRGAYTMYVRRSMTGSKHCFFYKNDENVPPNQAVLEMFHLEKPEI